MKPSPIETTRGARIRLVLAFALLLWIGLGGGIGPVVADWRLVIARGKSPDDITREVQRYQPLISTLPQRGTIGYLEPPDAATVAGTRRFFLAEYSLTPRLVVAGTAAPFVIVVPEALQANDGSAAEVTHRLSDFGLLAQFDNGMRIYRRLR